MICPNCKMENESDAIYCQYCQCLLKPKHTIFISHAATDKKIVRDFCEMLRLILWPFEIEIFCSSEPGAIECGKDSHKEIHDYLDKCDTIFCILTNNSYQKPWVMYEIGYSQGQSNKKKFKPIAIDIKDQLLKTGYPYTRFEVYECEKEKLSVLMIQLLNSIIPDSYKDKNDILKKSFAPHIQNFLNKIKKESKI